jgi:transposase
MGMPLSTDLRSRLAAAVAGGLSRRAAAERFGVSPTSAVRWVQAANTTGSVEARARDRSSARARRAARPRRAPASAVRPRGPYW